MMGTCKCGKTKIKLTTSPPGTMLQVGCLACGDTVEVRG